MIYVLPCDTIQQWDRFTIQHEPISSLDLMERAASQCVEWLCKKWSNQYSFAIFCGNGNNGGDGFAVARILLNKGYSVKVFIAPDAKRSHDNQANLNTLKGLLPTCIHEITDSKSISTSDIILDALFGTGISKPVDGLFGQCIETINKLSNTKVSIDIPSGLFPDEIRMDSLAVQADYTLTFQCFKRSFLFPETGSFCGKIIVLDIRLHSSFDPDGCFVYQLLDTNWAKSVHIPRKPFTHKGTYGHSLIIAGSHGKMGACILAAKACLRSGTGLLTLSIPETENQIIQTVVPEAMTIPYLPQDSLPHLESFNAIGVGCGLGTTETSYQLISNLLQKSGLPLVLDADALNSIASNKEWLLKIPKGSVITPHPKEFDRLFGESSTTYERFEKQIDQAKKWGLYILLKGRYTSIVTPEGEVFFNINGNPGMATGGSGDVLTGIITSLFAQYSSMELAVKLGCFIHGFAGDLAREAKTEVSLIASDIIEYLPLAFKNLFYTGQE